MEKKILIVEDEPDTLKLLKESLEQEGFQIITASDGIKAEELVLSEKPDLIILDVMLPKRNGFEVCQKLKQNKEIFSIPIIMLTAKTQYGDKLTGFLHGALDYLTKPFGIEELLSRVRKILSLKK